MTIEKINTYTSTIKQIVDALDTLSLKGYDQQLTNVHCIEALLELHNDLVEEKKSLEDEESRR